MPSFIEIVRFCFFLLFSFIIIFLFFIFLLGFFFGAYCTFVMFVVRRFYDLKGRDFHLSNYHPTRLIWVVYRFVTFFVLRLVVIGEYFLTDPGPL